MFRFFSLLLGAATLLAGCQQHSSTSAASAAAPVATLLAPKTAADARAAVGRYLQSQPDAALYVLDSARVNDNETTWQVLVPRTDWAKRMPNSARFEVEKTTGAVRMGTVK
ncbi:MAG TPA: hypothetical protein VF690_00235 [Hymenobacter sp.]|jgi:hypothetical protein